MRDQSDAAFMARACSEMAALQRSQSRIESDLRKPGMFVGLSLLDTIRTCLAHDLVRTALQVKQEFKIPGDTSPSLFAKEHAIFMLRLLYCDPLGARSAENHNG